MATLFPLLGERRSSFGEENHQKRARGNARWGPDGFTVIRGYSLRVGTHLLRSSVVFSRRFLENFSDENAPVCLFVRSAVS